MTVDAAAMHEVGPPTQEVLLEQSIRAGSGDDPVVVDELHTIADETHSTPEDGPPGLFACRGAARPGSSDG